MESMSTLILNRTQVLKNTRALRMLNEFREAAVQDEPLELRAHVVESGSGEGDGVPQRLISIRPRSQKVPAALLDAEAIESMARSLLVALAVEVLASQRVERLAFIGGSEEITPLLKAIRLVRTIDKVTLFDADILKSFQLSRNLQKALSIAVAVPDTASESAQNADVIVLNGGELLPDVILRPHAFVVALNFDSVKTLGTVPMWNVSSSHIDIPQNEELLPVLSGQVSPPNAPRAFVCLRSNRFLRLAVWHVFENARNDTSLESHEFESGNGAN
jgi:hypothetical protein